MKQTPGMVIMEATDYPGMSGSNTICAATVLVETGMIPMTEPVTEVVLETPTGLVGVEIECRNGLCEQVRFENVPAYVVGLDLEVDVDGLGKVSVDVAWGGVFFAFVDSASVGLEEGAPGDDPERNSRRRRLDPIPPFAAKLGGPGGRWQGFRSLFST